MLKNLCNDYCIIQTLNGNFRLKELSKVNLNTDSIELELYGTFDNVKIEYKNHIKDLKKLGLI